ncbi:MAG: helix-turn-helix domain-containing protein [Sphingomonas paucimobilis]
MLWNELGEQSCSFARTLSVIGDRWMLLILRDCFMAVRRFDDFHERLGIARPILTDRLRKLTETGVLAKIPYQTRPTRYEYRLTDKGLDLYPIIMGIVHWGDMHMTSGKGRPLLHRHVACGHVFDPVTTCSECGEPVTARDVKILLGPGADDKDHLPPALRPARVADSGGTRDD